MKRSACVSSVFALVLLPALAAHAQSWAPVWLEQQVMAEESVVADYFGVAIGVSGDYAVVGALNTTVTISQQGAAYVYRKGSDGWQRAAKLVADDAADGDHFGYAVAIDGDRILVGADGASPDQMPGRGAAYLFERDGDSWVQVHKFVSSDGQSYNNYGHAVTLQGNRVVIGAPFMLVDGAYAGGAVYVYTNTGGSWTEAKFYASDVMPFTRFGYAVALSGDRLLVGADGANVNGNFSQGAAYLYEFVGGGWSETAKLVASDGGFGSSLGTSVALDGDNAIAGAPYGDNGAAYVYTRAGNWAQAQKLVGADALAGDRVGFSLALDGNTLLVGASVATLDKQFGRGAVYRYGRGADGWQEQNKFVASDGWATDYFGYAVALDGDAIMIGADNAARDDSVEQGEGAVYFFRDDRIFASSGEE